MMTIEPSHLTETNDAGLVYSLVVLVAFGTLTAVLVWLRRRELPVRQ